MKTRTKHNGDAQPYTKRQIREAIAYWESQLGSRRAVNESSNRFDSLEDLLYEKLDERIYRNRALNNKLDQLYRKKCPSWDGDHDDEDYYEWRLGILDNAINGLMPELLSIGVERALAKAKTDIDGKFAVQIGGT